MRDARAQVATLPTVAVVEFTVGNGRAPADYGSVAAEQVSAQLASTGRVDVKSQDEVKRVLGDLGFAGRDMGSTPNLLRVANELRVGSIVSGEIVDYIVVPVSGGRQARVSLRAIVTDVASGLPVNGAAVVGESTVRTGQVEDSSLVREAITAAAIQAVRNIEATTLPAATILNTFVNQALINQGSRAGFRNGMEVIVLRGRDQVGVARVTEVDPDSSLITVTRSTRGFRPGDRVRSVAQVPAIGVFNSAGTPTAVRTRRTSNNSSIISVVLVLGLVGLLLSGGNSSSQETVTSVIAEPSLFPDNSGAPAVRVSWSPNGFAKGNANRVAWQVWRSDVRDTPVLVVGGLNTSAWDLGDTRSFAYTTFPMVGGISCDNTDFGQENAEDIAGIVPGRPYIYGVELVYGLSSIDLPDGGTGGTSGNTGGGIGGGTGGGTTGGGTTGGGTTGGGTTGGGTTGGGTGGGTAQTCYFISDRTFSKGTATPLARSEQVSPAASAVVSAPVNFTFNSVVTSAFPINVEYVVQLSTQPTFPSSSSQTVTVASFTSNAQGIVGTDVIDTQGPNIPAAIRNAGLVWWRVGARNVSDLPGPVRDATGQRFVFGSARNFTRPAPPPPPPLN